MLGVGISHWYCLQSHVVLRARGPGRATPPLLSVYHIHRSTSYTRHTTTNHNRQSFRRSSLSTPGAELLPTAWRLARKDSNPAGHRSPCGTATAPRTPVPVRPGVSAADSAGEPCAWENQFESKLRTSANELKSLREGIPMETLLKKPQGKLHLCTMSVTENIF